jgi:hypothetical protein
MSPFEGSIFFTPFFILGVIHIALSKGKALSALILTATGASGIAFGFFVHYSAVMQKYGYWLHHGMNNKNPNSTMLLSIFAVGVLLLIITLACVFAVKRVSRN